MVQLNHAFMAFCVLIVLYNNGLDRQCLQLSFRFPVSSLEDAKKVQRKPEKESIHITTSLQIPQPNPVDHFQAPDPDLRPAGRLANAKHRDKPAVLLLSIQTRTDLSE